MRPSLPLRLLAPGALLAACHAQPDHAGTGGMTAHYDAAISVAEEAGLPAFDFRDAQAVQFPDGYVPTADVWFDAGAGQDGGPHVTSHAPGEAGTDPANPARPDGGPEVCLAPEKLDLLFVIDNSASMKEEQGRVVAQLPSMVKTLTTGDLDGDGVQDFHPIDDLHLGVVSTDMGGSGITGIPTCGTNLGFGDDGVMIGATRDANCTGPVLQGSDYQTYVPGGTQTPMQLASDFGCLISLGTAGCGFEQPLESLYKALAPQTVKFGQGTGGHGDERNAGFVRADAALAVVVVSDEDDCSITDDGGPLFIPTTTDARVMAPGASTPIGLNLRCAYLAGTAESLGMMQPVSRYTDGLRALKPGLEWAIVYGELVGIPPALEGSSATQILADPSMQFSVNPNGASQSLNNDSATPNPACTTAGTSAAPGVRHVRAAQGFGANGVIRSVCADDYAPALNAIIERVVKVVEVCDPGR